MNNYYQLIIFGGFILILNIKCIHSECEKIIKNEQFIAKCYESSLREVNSFQQKNPYTELHVIDGTLEILRKNAITYPNLITLKLIDNGIENIYSGAFSNMASLTYLDLSRNQLESLPSKMFENNIQLRVLNLSQNSISNIKSDTFTRSSNLVELILHDNKLTTIKNDIIAPLKQLEYLNLGYNLIKVIEPTTFKENANLKKIELNNNPLKDLKQGTFLLNISKTNNHQLKYPSASPLTSIHELNLNRCELTSLKNHYFINLRRLKTLFVGYNKISHFESNNIFKENLALINLYLYANNITVLPSKFFSSLRSLEFLTLEDNKIADLPADLFQNTQISKLKYLRLNNNKISKLNPQIFKYLTALQELSLAGNPITYIEPNAFDNLMHLSTLTLNQNALKELKSNIFANLIELEKLKISDNGITKIESGAFNSSHGRDADKSSRILHLDLSKNNLKHLYFNMFAPLTRLISMDLTFSSVETMDLNVFQPMGETLQVLDLSGNQIEELKLGIFDDLEYVNFLGLNRNLLKTIHGDLFKNMISLEKLGLSENMLKTIPVELFNIPRLFEVKLDQNHLIDLSPEIFEGSDSRVERLHIYGNKLTFLDEHFLERSKLKHIRLGGNPWQCSCLNEIMNDVYRLNVQIINPEFYFEGSNPVCVVTKNNSCIRETYLAELLFKRYMSLKHIKYFNVGIWTWYW